MNQDSVDEKLVQTQKIANESEEEYVSIKPGDIIQGRFLINQLIGEGSFGQVYKVTDNKNENQVLAMKVEEDSDETSMLEREIKVLIDLRKKQGFPQIKFYGQEKGFTYCIMTYLGKNLENITRKLGGQLSITTALRVAVQIIERIESLHNCRYLHRDIKPDNFVLEPGNNPKSIYLIDFGLAKHYINSKGEHIQFVKKAGLIGTARYASVSAHEEMEQGRRDDLESIAYILIYLATGQLPWMNLQIDQKELKYQKIYQMKKQIKPDQLCAKLPSCFTRFFSDIKQLGFKDQPNYNQLKKYFQDEIERQSKNPAGYTFDWEKLPEFQKKKHLTVHIMQTSRPEDQQHQIQQFQQQQNQPQLMKQQIMQHQDSGTKKQQGQTFEQMMDEKKKGTKKTLYSPTGKSKPRNPIMINIVEPDKNQQEKKDQLLIQQQIPSILSPRQNSYSNTYLQIPQLNSMSNIQDTYPQYQASVATSKMIHYEWSEKVESEGGALPIWELDQQPGFQKQEGILQGIRKPSMVFIKRKERKAHTCIIINLQEIDSIRSIQQTLIHPVNSVIGDDENFIEGLNTLRAKIRGSLKILRPEIYKQVTDVYYNDDSLHKPACNTFEDLYEIGAIIGQGAHGIVKLCYRKQDKSIYAVKKIYRTEDPELVNTIVKTFEINRSLNDIPNVIRAYDLFIDEKSNNAYWVMELSDYQDLETISKKGLKDQHIMQLIDQMSLTLQLMHERGISHRDLKPDNILIKLLPKGCISIKIIDFGVSKKFLVNQKNLSTNRDMWTRTGSILFSAPEIFQGGGYNEKIDIWALGVIIYQLFCGYLPFHFDTQLDTIEAITSSDTTFLTKPEFLRLNYLQQDILKRMLNRDPNKRLSAQGYYFKQSLEIRLHPLLECNGTSPKQEKKIKDDIEVKRGNSYDLNLLTHSLINLQQIDRAYAQDFSNHIHYHKLLSLDNIKLFQEETINYEKKTLQL
ncbi:hypothetical protein pb186bvf_010715 [Paramecium bursaria]